MKQHSTSSRMIMKLSILIAMLKILDIKMKNDYRIILDDVECRVDRETWNYIWDWLSWH